MRYLLIVSLLLSSLIAVPAALAQETDWYATGAAAVKERLVRRPNRNQAKNVILFIGDGMGVSTVTAARIFDGQLRGEKGEDNVLSFERFPHTALVKTYNTNQQVSDSAGTATAMNTGVKTRAGVIGISEEAEREDCAAGIKYSVRTLAEIAEARGKATGIVSTARITHATPAAVYAHAAERNWEGERDLSVDARTAGCRSIARQLVEFSAGDGMEIALGGGAGKFTPELLARWQELYPDGVLVRNQQALRDVNFDETGHVLGLFAKSHMTYMTDRGDDSTEPTLSEMTSRAIDFLERNDSGYYLMVEGARIDHGHHLGVAGKALTETQEFARAIEVALDRVDLDETLVLVTADHSHVMTMAGYPTRGNPILGLVEGNDDRGNPSGEPATATDGQPYTTLGYQNGPGAVAGARPAPETGLRARQQALVPTGYHSGEVKRLSETHGGEDVALYAAGPWSELAAGVIEQHVIYHIIRHAYGWSDQ